MKYICGICNKIHDESESYTDGESYYCSIKCLKEDYEQEKDLVVNPFEMQNGKSAYNPKSFFKEKR